MTSLLHANRAAQNLAPPCELTREEARALAFLRPLSGDYPDIVRWFIQKVAPGVRKGTRLLLPVERQGQLVGLGIAKNEAAERKICTVRISPEYTGRGLGVRLFDDLLRWLDDDHPLVTVSAVKLPQFERIFDYYGFNLTSAHEGLYVPKSIELGYNESLTDAIVSPDIPSNSKVLTRPGESRV